MCKITSHPVLPALNFFFNFFIFSTFLRKPERKHTVVDTEVWAFSLCLDLFNHEGRGSDSEVKVCFSLSKDL